MHDGACVHIPWLLETHSFVDARFVAYNKNPNNNKNTPPHYFLQGESQPPLCRTFVDDNRAGV
jgi:hypothetical protein